jgi:hypothetical protein
MTQQSLVVNHPVMQLPRSRTTTMSAMSSSVARPRRGFLVCRSVLRNPLAWILGLTIGALAASRTAHAHEVAEAANAEMAPVPPHVEGTPVAVATNPGTPNYCFEGAHPIDPSVGGGVTWEATAGRHLHPYPPLDLRLFALRDGCYYFIGDPSDFGYRGRTFAYYGAHPVGVTHGGGWCFMIGGHAHLWGPWSPLFVTAGPWYYWQGPYDPFFWSYWPYYAVYYGHHYPRYYGGGRYAGAGIWHTRGRHFGGPRGAVVAPPIGPVPAPVRANPAGAVAGSRAFHGGPVTGSSVGRNYGWRRDPAWGGNWGGSSAWGATTPAPTPNAPAPGFGGVGRSSGPSSVDGWVGGGNRGWTPSPNPGRAHGGWSTVPRATPSMAPVLRGNSGSFYRSAPVAPSFRGGGQFAPRSGGFRSR